MAALVRLAGSQGGPVARVVLVVQLRRPAVQEDRVVDGQVALPLVPAGR